MVTLSPIAKQVDICEMVKMSLAKLGGACVDEALFIELKQSKEIDRQTENVT